MITHPTGDAFEYAPAEGGRGFNGDRHFAGAGSRESRGGCFVSRHARMAWGKLVPQTHHVRYGDPLFRSMTQIHPGMTGTVIRVMRGHKWTKTPALHGALSGGKAPRRSRAGSHRFVTALLRACP